MRTNVYNVIGTVDGEWATFNVWADNKREAHRMVMDRLANDGATFAIDTAVKISTDTADSHGNVLWLR